MFCSQCGTEIPEGSAFCHKCGSKTADSPAGTGQARSGPSSVTGTAVRSAPPHAPPFSQRLDEGATTAGQKVIGAIVLIGAALAVIGSLMPWLDAGWLGSKNGFGAGYLTDPSGGLGKDGIVILAAALAAGALAIPYFIARSSSAKILAGLGALLLGLGVGGLAGYDLGRFIKDSLDFCDCLDFIGTGIYLAVAGGVIVTFAAVAGMINAAIQPNIERTAQ
jgi:zinc-ribbon domain